jgi:hypothetical protein
MNSPRRSIVHCIDSTARGRAATLARSALTLVAVFAAACSGPPADRAPGEGEGATARPAPVTPQPAAPPAPTAEVARGLPPPRAARNWVEVRQQAAERLVAANPGITYLGRVPDQLLAIPVLEVELNGDGSVRRIEVLREPRQAKDTLKIAVEAVRRAAPFGDVSRLPRPWKFTETFLFDDARRFKPRTLDR